MAALVPRWEYPVWLRVVWAVLLALLAAVTGVTQVLDRQVPSNEMTWVHSPKLLISLVVTLAALTCADHVRRAYYRITDQKREERAVILRNDMGALIVTVSEVTGRSTSDIGCGLFLRQGRGLRRRARLKRIQRVRLVDVLRESKVTFILGKGTVGRCWEFERTVHKDWRQMNRDYNKVIFSDPQWEALDDKVKDGFTKKNFLTLVGKYAEVLAEPIMVNGRFRAV